MYRLLKIETNGEMPKLVAHLNTAWRFGYEDILPLFHTKPTVNKHTHDENGGLEQALRAGELDVMILASCESRCQLSPVLSSFVPFASTSRAEPRPLTPNPSWSGSSATSTGDQRWLGNSLREALVESEAVQVLCMHHEGGLFHQHRSPFGLLAAQGRLQYISLGAHTSNAFARDLAQWAIEDSNPGWARYPVQTFVAVSRKAGGGQRESEERGMRGDRRGERERDRASATSGWRGHTTDRLRPATILAFPCTLCPVPTSCKDRSGQSRGHHGRSGSRQTAL